MSGSRRRRPSETFARKGAPGGAPFRLPGTAWRRAELTKQKTKGAADRHIGCAHSLAGQARGEGGKDGRSVTTKRDGDICSGTAPDCLSRGRVVSALANHD